MVSIHAACAAYLGKPRNVEPPRMRGEPHTRALHRLC